MKRFLLIIVTALFLSNNMVVAQSSRRSTGNKARSTSVSNNLSWMNGHWNMRTQVGTVNLYIDANNKKIKVYSTLYSDGRPELMYNGSYRIHNGSDYGSRYGGYKAIKFGDTVIFADPNACKLCDGPGSGYYQKM